MKTVQKSLPIALTVHVPVPAPKAAPQASKLNDADMATLHASKPLTMPEPKATKPIKADVCKPVPAAAPIHAAASLLELVQAMDGSKEARYNVALDAVTAAYSVALTYGNKTQLIAVLQSTGRKACERAMRTAVQTVGALGYHKDAATRQEAIDSACATAMTIFADIACKAPVKRAPAVPVDVVAEATGAGVADTDTEADTASGAGAGSPALDIVGYAQMLPDLELGALIESLLAVVAARHTPMLKTA